MNILELKKQKGYAFECNIDSSMGNLECYEEWMAALVWLGDDIGAEYNFCIDNGGNYCAIYPMEFDKEADDFVTDHGIYIPYEIDFNDENWVENLENAMCEALIQFFEL